MLEKLFKLRENGMIDDAGIVGGICSQLNAKLLAGICL